jgi:CRP-like cAMP-binding protein
MDINLILSAQTLRLAPLLKCSEPVSGLRVLKNVATRTYLKVTPEQWLILQKFEKPKMVPAMLGEVIRDRQCLPLGESYELILKAFRAGILLEPGPEPEAVQANDWHWGVRPSVLRRPVVALFCAGLVMALGFHPRLPPTVLDGLVGLALLSAARSFGELLACCMIRGAGGEVYRPRWRWAALPPHFATDQADAVMLPRGEQVIIALASPAALAAAAGIAAWHRPEWAFFSLVGLVLSLRPIFGARLAMLIQVGSARAPSDSEHAYVFPPNRRPEIRARLLRRALSQATTWCRVAYAVVWTLVVLYWIGRLTEIPPWSMAFWRINGLRVAVATCGSLALLCAGYLSWEVYVWARGRARLWRNTVRLWRSRWFAGDAAVPDESARLKLLAASPMFSGLQPAQRLELARKMAVTRHGPWRALLGNCDIPTHVSIIVSGKVSLRRRLPSGRTVEVHVIAEGNVIGLHDLADPNFPAYRVRSLTPVTLLTLERPVAEELIVARITQATLADTVLKRPFLRRIPLCKNWHLQAVDRFARLSSISDYPAGGGILNEGQVVEDFFVIFQGDAKVSREGRAVATIHSGDFFGEIGLMQNSSPNASVTAHNGTRCLRIPRVELLRFVTHNYTVALELERVSSKRLGRPLFPLKMGDFRPI